MTKRILITGVDGFLGKALKVYLNNRRFRVEVFGVSRRSGSAAAKILRCDLNRPEAVKKVLLRVKPDCIFHLAGGRAANWRELYKANFSATEVLLRTVTELHLRSRILIPGTAAEYGLTTAQKIFRENEVLHPDSAYGVVKFLQTRLALKYAKSGMDIIVARIFNVCGHGTPPELALGKFAAQIAAIEKGKQIPVLETGNLGGKRDFLDIEDVCSALWALSCKAPGGEIYNVCSGKGFTMRSLVKKLLKLSTKKISISEKNGKTGNSVGSNVKIRQATSWRPRVNLDESLRNTLQYYRNVKS